MNIRHAIYNNIKGNNEAQFKEIIEDAIETGEEKTLPGLGYFFELFWKNASPSSKSEMLKLLVKAANE